PRAREGIELERAVAALDRVAGAVGQAALARRLAVDPDRPAARPAEQVVDRRLQRLADDVPERDLEPADRAVEVEAAAFDRHVAPDGVGEVLDRERVAID